MAIDEEFNQTLLTPFKNNYNLSKKTYKRENFINNTTLSKIRHKRKLSIIIKKKKSLDNNVLEFIVKNVNKKQEKIKKDICNTNIYKEINSKTVKCFENALPCSSYYTSQFMFNSCSNKRRGSSQYSNQTFKVYRCQFNAKEETCCCSCNSDSMFEVMKSLYDCYKKKNCDNCKCILCGHLPREERKLGEVRSSKSVLSTQRVGTDGKKEPKKSKDISAEFQGKTKDQKEKILKDLIKKRIPLPEGKTASEKELIEKVKASVGLPPAPQSKSIKEKYKKAMAAGLISPLEGKTNSQKEKILKGLADAGIPLPEGRTASEKKIIAKISPKTDDEREKTLKDMATKGALLPDGKTESEKKLIEKVRKDLGLPPTPKTASIKEKYQKAADKGLMVPLEGKTAAQKEKVLKGLQGIGIPLPEGRTPSEKALIYKITGEALKTLAVGVPSEKLRKAKDAGFITPLEGKDDDQKEKILKGLAMHGVPLPEGKTTTEKNLIEKVRNEVGLPPTPKTDALKEKYKKAMKAGFLTPLEGKNTLQKEKILKGLNELEVPLPEGRTPSEKALIAKIKETSKKSPEQKENMLKGLVKQRLPLPEGKTPSEKKLIDKVRLDMGLPPTPNTPALKEKYTKAQSAGVLTPLDGKTAVQKENILRKQKIQGIPLPQGRTPSEKALIEKIKAEKTPAQIPSAKLKAAKDEGIITPLEGKSKEQKEKILRGLAKHGLPLPEGNTASEKKLIDKVRFDVGLPPSPKTPSLKVKYSKAQAAGIMTPLEGKTKAKKEEILRKQIEHGLPLPEGRTPSEKELIKKLKVVGALSSLKGKTPEEKEKLLKDLVKQGLPLPEGKSSSEKKLIDKVRFDMGLPPTPNTTALKEKYTKAQSAGVLTPLDGKTAVQKENIIRKQNLQGIPLPQGRTPSEKALIEKIKAEKTPAQIPSAKLKAAKAEGLITPLEGKSIEQKEKILKGLAKHNLPLPEGKSASEKKLIEKVRVDVGLPPSPKTPSLKVKYSKAQAAGILTPLEGKSKSQKETILRKQFGYGLPLPEGRTNSEKELIKKIQMESQAKPGKDNELIQQKQIPATLSEKAQKLDKKTAQGIKEGKGPVDECICGMLTPDLQSAPKVSQKTLMRNAKMGAGALPQPQTQIKTKSKGIVHEFEDIVKTTTCDRACGCDKKKIRFKHSYVKIKVTSPDLSNICPCPEGCLPGGKHGAFTDNEGIKVTVGQAVGTPSYNKRNSETRFKVPITCESYFSIDSITVSAGYISENDFNYRSDYTNKFTDLECIFVRRPEHMKSSYEEFDRYQDVLTCIYGSNNEFAIHNHEKSNSDGSTLSSNGSSKLNSALFEICESLSLLSYTEDSASDVSCGASRHSLSFECEAESFESSYSCFAEETSCVGNTFADNNQQDYHLKTKKSLLVFEMFNHNMKQSSRSFFSLLNSKSVLNSLKDVLSKDLCSTSSLLIILSNTDDEKSSFTGSNSTICILMSDNDSEAYNAIGSQLYRNESQQRRIALGHQSGFKISTKPKTSKGNFNKHRNASLSQELHKRNSECDECKENVKVQCTSQINSTEAQSIPLPDIFCKPNNTDEVDMCNSIGQSELLVSRNCGTNTSSTNEIHSNKSCQVPHKSKNVAPQMNTTSLKPKKTYDCHRSRDYDNLTHLKSIGCGPDSADANVDIVSKTPKVEFYDESCRCPTPKTLDASPYHPYSVDKIKKIIISIAKELASTATRNTKEEQQEAKPPEKDTAKDILDCQFCGKPQPYATCPCERHQRLTDVDFQPAYPNNQFPCYKKDKKKRNKRVFCECPTDSEDPTKCFCTNSTLTDKKKKTKRTRESQCECYQDGEETFVLGAELPELWVDPKKLMQVKSGWTQTVSGFTLEIVPKGINTLDPNVSFENALRFFAKYPLEETVGGEDCNCNFPPNKNKCECNKNKNNTCECPELVEDPTDPGLADFARKMELLKGGFKLQVGGKGTASSGLTGIFCFDMLQEVNQLNLERAPLVSEFAELQT